MPSKQYVVAIYYISLAIIVSACASRPTTMAELQHGAVAYQAAVAGDMEALTRELSEENITINEKNKNGQTCLHLASSGGHYEMVKFLIENGADVNTEKNKTPYKYSWSTGSLNFAARDNGDAYTPLHSASIYGHYDIVRLLVENGAEINHRNTAPVGKYGSQQKRLLLQELNGATPLHVAARAKQLEIAKYLLSKGADVDARSQRGNSVLHFAYFVENNQPMIDLLMDAGADATALNASGESPAEAGSRVAARSK